MVNKRHFTLWVISGCLAVLIRDIYSLVVFLMGLAKLPIWTIAAGLFIIKSQFHTVPGITIGIITDLCIGGLLGIVVGAIIDWQEGKNHLWLGIGVGIAAWLIFYGIVLHNLPQTKGSAPHDNLTTILALIGHVIYGIAAAWIYLRLLTAKKPETQ